MMVNKKQKTLKEHENIYIHVKKKSVNNFFGFFLFLVILSVSVLMISAIGFVPKSLGTARDIGISTYGYLSLAITISIALLAGIYLFIFSIFLYIYYHGDIDGLFKGEYE